MRTKGTIASWNDDKGYGFISPATGGDRVFVHIKAFANRKRRPTPGQVVSYALSRDRLGRPCATQATLAGDRLAKPGTTSRGFPAVIVAIAFLVMVGVLAASARLPYALCALYAVASLFTFLAYAMDKAAARSGAWRTAENTLHLLSLAGGWPGALIAQQQLRHKSSKRSFRRVFWLTVWLNCGALAWLLTPAGADTLRIVMTGMST